jgi:phosphoglucomutase
MYQRTTTITEYKVLEAQDVDLGTVGRHQLGAMVVDVVDPVTDYAALMETLFDFPAIRAMFAGGFRMRMDSMCAVTGPYAVEILENRLGAPKGTWSTRPRCRISAACTPTRTRPGPRR